MTWREFKYQVDSKLDELGLEDDVEMWYVDIHSAYEKLELLHSEKENKIAIHVPRSMN